MSASNDILIRICNKLNQIQDLKNKIQNKTKKLGEKYLNSETIKKVETDSLKRPVRIDFKGQDAAIDDAIKSIEDLEEKYGVLLKKIREVMLVYVRWRNEHKMPGGEDPSTYLWILRINRWSTGFAPNIYWYYGYVVEAMNFIWHDVADPDTEPAIEYLAAATYRLNDTKRAFEPLRHKNPYDSLSFDKPTNPNLQTGRFALNTHQVIWVLPNEAYNELVGTYSNDHLVVWTIDHEMPPLPPLVDLSGEEYYDVIDLYEGVDYERKDISLYDIAPPLSNAVTKPIKLAPHVTSYDVKKGRGGGGGWGSYDHCEYSATADGYNLILRQWCTSPDFEQTIVDGKVSFTAGPTLNNNVDNPTYPYPGGTTNQGIYYLYMNGGRYGTMVYDGLYTINWVSNAYGNAKYTNISMTADRLNCDGDASTETIDIAFNEDATWSFDYVYSEGYLYSYNSDDDPIPPKPGGTPGIYADTRNASECKDYSPPAMWYSEISRLKVDLVTGDATVQGGTGARTYLGGVELPDSDPSPGGTIYHMFDSAYQAHGAGDSKSNPSNPCGEECCGRLYDYISSYTCGSTNAGESATLWPIIHVGGKTAADQLIEANATRTTSDPYPLLDDFVHDDLTIQIAQRAGGSFPDAGAVTHMVPGLFENTYTSRSGGGGVAYGDVCLYQGWCRDNCQWDFPIGYQSLGTECFREGTQSYDNTKSIEDTYTNTGTPLTETIVSDGLGSSLFDDDVLYKGQIMDWTETPPGGVAWGGGGKANACSMVNNVFPYMVITLAWDAEDIDPFVWPLKVIRGTTSGGWSVNGVLDENDEYIDFSYTSPTPLRVFANSAKGLYMSQPIANGSFCTLRYVLDNTMFEGDLKIDRSRKINIVSPNYKDWQYSPISILGWPGGGDIALDGYGFACDIIDV